MRLRINGRHIDYALPDSPLYFGNIMNIARNILTTALIAAGALPSLAQAADTDRTGFYGFGTVGKSISAWKTEQRDSAGNVITQADKNGQSSSKSETKHPSTNGWTIGGGYRFNQHFGTEMAFRSMMGPAKISHVGNYSSKSINVGAVGYLPLGERFELFGNAMLGQSDNRFTPKAGSEFTKTSGHSTQLTLGLGANMYLNEKLAIRTEFAGLGAESKSNRRSNQAGNKKAAVATVGLQYRF